ncbi:sugar ABC transporter ATP-binding protein (plasmid) [Devosia neptuniae]|uniref:Sugar ABC transporter ATP-binding protein n=1 Tax=Devosia neptuniae TaxID=191302 RepID=A0ABY6C7B6_9HYPH|nr:sugar ABC transporter ATP-binding protein [Devosia neptuniae]UXN68101.1 sugar ABC transporter ATP-binding protein [Devosia neptuniae]
MVTNGTTSVRLWGVEKSFGSSKILHDIKLDFRAGEVHALIGENGAGKSSVGKIIGGYYSADRGEVEISGTPLDQSTPRRALQLGVAMIHQELQLVPQLTVAENVFLGLEANVAGLLSGSDNKRFAALEERCRFGLDPRRKAEDLSIADRQKVEIMRAIARDARIIIMDEPTSSLTADEAERLHRVIADLRAQGRTIIYVTHFLDHVLAACDRVTIMRDGRVVRTGDIAGETKQSLVEAMLGKSAEVAYPELPARPDASVAPRIAMRGVSSHAGIRDINLAIRPGEVVGLVGLVGSGRSEVARALFGADKALTGTITLDGEDLTRLTPKEAVRRGIAFIPEDRRKQGLNLVQRTRPNMSLPHLSQISRFGFLDMGEERRRTKAMIEHFGISPAGIDGEVAYYSGGNQQKVLLSKWAYGKPGVVILDEPSRGVDIGARRRIHDFIVELAQTGAAVLLISSELEEVLKLSHRAYLMSQGRIIGEVESATISVEDALFRLFNVQKAQEQAVLLPEQG